MTRRAIFVPSSRGGVGKSTFVRLLSELHRERETGAVLVDADARVGQLIKHVGEREVDTGRLLTEQSLDRGVQALDWHADVRGRDAIASYLEHSRDAIFDLPGGSLATLRALDVDTGFFSEIVPALGFTSTVVAVVTPYLETWADAASVAEWLPTSNLLLVRNMGFGDAEDFRDWDASETRAKVIAAGACEILLPRLEARIAARISYHRLRFHDAQRSAHVPVMDRGRARAWLIAATEAIERAADLLGLGGRPSASKSKRGGA